MLLHMTTTPDPISYSTAHELRKEFCRSLGFDPNDVTRIEFTSRFIKVTDKNRLVHVLTTQSHAVTAWTTHYPAGYGHAPQVQQ